MTKNLTMKTIATFSCFVLLAFSSPFFAQSGIDSLKKFDEPQFLLPYFNPSNNFSNYFFSGELNNLKIGSKNLNDTSSLWLRTRMQLNEMIFQENFSSNLQSNILSPLNQQYSAMQNMKFLRSVLGAFSVGAAGYLAYQHIKKYGFLKKR